MWFYVQPSLIMMMAELCSDYYFKEATCHTRKTATCQRDDLTNDFRIGPIRLRLLEQYMKVFHPEETWQSPEYLFYITRNGIRKQMNDDTIRIRFQKYVLKAKEKCGSVPDNIHPHLWRHTRAMHLYQHGMDLTLISQWLGHINLETTLIYAHADTKHKKLSKRP